MADNSSAFESNLYQGAAAGKQDRREYRVGSIGGRVISDDGRPLGNVVVFVRGLDLVALPARTAITSSDGTFRMDDLPVGTYTISPQVPGYITDADSVTEDTIYYRLGDAPTVRMTKGGVITGKVMNVQGEPVIAINVSATRIRDLAGGAVRDSSLGNARLTDDRGVYRIFGLPPGVYLVSASADRTFTGRQSPFRSDAPTYYPSEVRGTAAEVIVRSRDEITGIDIRHRGDKGHVITGTIDGYQGSGGSVVNVSVIDAVSGTTEASTIVAGQGNKTFAIYGLRDGEYDLVASRGNGAGGTDVGGFTDPQHVIIKGMDVTGVKLFLTPYSVISGRVALEAISSSNLAGCDDGAITKTKSGEIDPSGINSFLEEMVVRARREPGGIKVGTNPVTPLRIDSEPSRDGGFILHNVSAGTYHLEMPVLDGKFYVRSIAKSADGSPQPKLTAEVLDVGRKGLSVKPGEKWDGISIMISVGAASMNGSIGGPQSKAIPEHVQVYLVPVDPKEASNLLRYYESSTGVDGAFTFANLAPGQYWVIARDTRVDKDSMVSRLHIWDSITRDLLRRDAESLNHLITLSPCQRIVDYQLSYSRPARKGDKKD